MIKYMLVMVFLSDGVPRMNTFGFYERAQCINSAISLSESGRAQGSVILSADCYPVAPSWGLNL